MSFFTACHSIASAVLTVLNLVSYHRARTRGSSFGYIGFMLINAISALSTVSAQESHLLDHSNSPLIPKRNKLCPFPPLVSIIPIYKMGDDLYAIKILVGQAGNTQELIASLDTGSHELFFGVSDFGRCVRYCEKVDDRIADLDVGACFNLIHRPNFNHLSFFGVSFADGTHANDFYVEDKISFVDFCGISPALQIILVLICGR
jgi:hypothetical protein